MRKAFLISLVIGTSCATVLWLYVKANPEPPIIITSMTSPIGYVAENVAGHLHAPSGLVAFVLMTTAFSLIAVTIYSIISMFKSRTND